MKVNASNTQLVLFDIDGTLLRTKGLGRAATKAAMLEIFGTCGTLEAYHFSGKTDWGTLVELLLHEGFKEDFIAECIPTFEEAIGRAMAAVLHEFEIEIMPGAHEVVAELRAREDMLLGILTGNVAVTANLKLRAAGFDPAWFPITAYGSEAPDRNHLPTRALERACDYLGHPLPPQQVTIIGDTEYDIACARTLGARAVAVTTGFTPRDTLAALQPDVLLDDLWGLAEILVSQA